MKAKTDWSSNEMYKLAVIFKCHDLITVTVTDYFILVLGLKSHSQFLDFLHDGSG